MCKLDLKDVYFCIPLAEELKKFVRCYWEGDLYQFLCLYFGLAPAPYVLAKLLKIPIAFLRRIGTLIITYLNNMLLFGRTAEKVQMYRDTVILLLQELGFVINLKKLVMIPSQEIEFLGMVINSKRMTISLPEEKLQKVKLCLDLYQRPQVSILQLMKVLGHLMLTIQAVLPAWQNSRTTADSSLKRKEVLSGKQKFEQHLKIGTSMVDKKFGDFQWYFSSQTGSTSCAPEGCFIDRLGCRSPRKINRRNMVISRKKMVYQRVGTTSSKASPPNIS